MNIFVWHSARRGTGPRYAAQFAQALRAQPSKHVVLSLAADVEVSEEVLGPRDCFWPRGRGSLPLSLRLLLRPRWERPRLAFCIMPGSLDPLILLALRLVGARTVIVIRESDPNTGFLRRVSVQRLLSWLTGAVIAIDAHHLRDRAAVGFGKRPRISFPVLPVDADRTSETDITRSLLFIDHPRSGKSITLLAAAIALMSADTPITIRVATKSPASSSLAKLLALRCVTVEKWSAAKTDIHALLAKSDGVILPNSATGRSGIAAFALSAGRQVVATRDIGLPRYLYRAPNTFLCFPHPEGLAMAILEWLHTPPSTVAPIDTVAVWYDAVTHLLDDISAVLPGLPNSVPEQPREWKLPSGPQLLQTNQMPLESSVAIHNTSHD